MPGFLFFWRCPHCQSSMGGIPWTANYCSKCGQSLNYKDSNSSFGEPPDVIGVKRYVLRLQYLKMVFLISLGLSMYLLFKFDPRRGLSAKALMCMSPSIISIVLLFLALRCPRCGAATGGSKATGRLQFCPHCGLDLSG
jgi:predicted amidophosphoribosyltransferase